jgi:hypothetical protein
MQNNDITLINSGDISIYKSDIDVISSEYESSLKDPELIYKSSNCFIGLLNMVRYNYIKPILSFNRLEKNKYDFELLDNIFQNVYLYLCNKYDKVPTIIGFCNFMVDIDSQYIYGVYEGSEKASQAAKTTIKKWYEVCKSANLSKVVDNNGIGAMFNLKANYGMSDQKPQQVIVSATPAACLSADVLSSLLPDSVDEKTDI